jgi:uncharacterized membrane protein
VATLSIGLGHRAGFVGALAAAGADTWATELGLLSHQKPRLITTWQPVAAGTSGGITPAGLAAGLGGALAVGLAWATLGGGWRAVNTALIAGTVGSVTDSLLGATVQALYGCARCGTLTEQAVHTRCGEQTQLVRGYWWVTNDTVNALATLIGAAVGSAFHSTERGGHVRGGASVRRRVGWGERIL